MNTSAALYRYYVLVCDCRSHNSHWVFGSDERCAVGSISGQSRVGSGRVGSYLGSISGISCVISGIILRYTERNGGGGRSRRAGNVIVNVVMRRTAERSPVRRRCPAAPKLSILEAHCSVRESSSYEHDKLE